MANVMDVKDALSGALAECYMTIEGNRYNVGQMKSIEIKFDKSKSEVKRLGTTGTANKATGWKGTGSGTMYYNTSLIRKMFYKYKETGLDTYFDIFISNEDPTSSVGKQSIVVKDCNVDGGILAKFDVDSEILDEDIDFTFDDFEYGGYFADPPTG